MNKAWSAFPHRGRMGVDSYRYDEETQDLHVRYRKSPTTYCYRLVAPLTVKRFIYSATPTTFLNRFIKELHQCDILRGEEAA